MSITPTTHWTETAYKRFWARMGEIFGTPWFSHNGPEVNASWTASLAELSFDQVFAAIEHYRKSGDAYPPNLSAFMGAAKQFKKTIDYKTLPAPAKDMADITKKISNLRQANGGRRNVFLPGESWPDYQAAKHKAKQAGISAEKFDMERMKLNGWTEELESGFISPRK